MSEVSAIAEGEADPSTSPTRCVLRCVDGVPKNREFAIKRRKCLLTETTARKCNHQCLILLGDEFTAFRGWGENVRLNGVRCREGRLSLGDRLTVGNSIWQIVQLNPARPESRSTL